ncbi:MAG: fructose-1,6-bisphosphate aldolase, partial [Proteobacteria bacterium]|nr:fructose-1,6-bisphosphate aldolase [Pseudomonadota bacterium]
ELFNQYGGTMPQTWGVPIEEIVTGIQYGVRKVNIDTDCRLAMTGKFREVGQKDTKQFDPRKFLTPAMKAMEDLCRDRYEQFNTAGKASKITAISLEEMARQYKSGALDPQIAMVNKAS